MAIFKTNLEVILASEEDVESYYQTAAKEISLLLEKYDIRNAKGKLKEVSADHLKTLLSFTGFFQATPLKFIFFDQKQQFVPHEIIHAFRSIISDPPLSIKAIFFNTFITLLQEKGWDKPLSTYFEKQYNCPSDGIILLDDLQDFSLGFGVYRVVFQLRTPRREKIIVFLKRAPELGSYNELLYCYLQKNLLQTASLAKMPWLLSNTENEEELLLSPSMPGIVSDTALSILTIAYRKTKNSNLKFNLKKALEIIIEAFISHAALGDLLNRNDRHLMNSLLAFVVDGIPQENTLEDLNNPEKVFAYAKNIVTNKTRAISLIDIDLKWLLGEKNADWAFVDIDFGLSEINLLSLLNEFNDYNSKTNRFFEQRKKYLQHFFNVYCQQQQAIIEEKELLLSAIKQIYPSHLAEDKIKLLTQRINLLAKSKKPNVKLFKRYLLNFRTRLVYKATLIALARMAKKSNNINLFNALQETHLTKYLPPQAESSANESSVFFQLQCFRGVLAKKDRVKLCEPDREAWETVAANISTVAKKYNRKLFKALEDKKQFIKDDTVALLKAISRSETIMNN